MPYRRLPNTDSARLRAMKRAIEMSKDIPPFRLAFSMKTLVKLQALLPLFENAISHQRQTLVNQSEKSRSNQETARKARVYLTHFLKVMNMAVSRGEMPPETRTFYSIATDDTTVPSLATDNELVAWGKRIIDGEEYRIRKGNMPVTNPTIAVVKARYEKFLETRNHYKTINLRATDCVTRTADLRNEADNLITLLWNEIEASFASLPEEEKRAEAEKYGLVYIFRKNEHSRKDLSPALLEVNREKE
jgi:hypothetical protein